MEVKEREVTSTQASSMINPIITTTVYIKGRCHEIVDNEDTSSQPPFI
jgi:hypothetical protein